MTTEERFLKDVATHEMIVLRDDGVYRHIRFKRPGTSCMHFDLVTWPGYLAYSGDMGCYVFSRLNDMFEFFRTDRRHQDGSGLKINQMYWSEKLRAVDGNRRAAGAKEYSQEKFRAAVWSDFVAWVRYKGRRFTKEQRRDLWTELKDSVLEHEHDEHAAYNAASEFSWRADGAPRYKNNPDFEFVDFWDHDLTDYTYSFTWCCYALAWGVLQYDKAMQGKEAA